MQNKEFDKLVESFLKPKTKLEDNASFSLASLLSLVEEVEKTNKLVNEIVGTTVLPTVGAQQKKYGGEPAEATKFFQIFQSVLAQDILNVDDTIDQKMKILIKIVNNLKTYKAIPDTPEYLSQTFSIILFVGSLNNMIGNITPDLPTVAGTFFEKFIAFMAKGTAMGEEKKIYDVLTQKEYISLKLIKKVSSYTGSINGMIEFFTGQKNIPITPDLEDKQNKNISLLVGVKEDIEGGSIKFYSFRFALQDFIKMLGEEKIQNYNSSIITSKELDELTNIQNELEAKITASEDTREFEIQLQDVRQEIAKKLAEIDRLKTVRDRTQFDISFSKLKPFQTLLTGTKDDILSMSPDAKQKIIDANQKLFNENIRAIIEESNAVYYKVNNFLLSDEKQRKVNALEAYDSVTKLEQNLVKYTT
jgi:CheY-specific phosphatase CheX